MPAESQPPSQPASGLDRRWRTELERIQQETLPSGRVAVTCNAPFGGGGLGRHLQEIVEALERGGRSHVALCSSVPAPGESGLRSVRLPGLRLVQSMPPVRYSSAWRAWTGSVAFDRRVARQLPAAEHLIAFNGQALAQLRAHRRQRGASAALVSANSHLRRVARLHARAYRRYPLERSWTGALVRRNCAEYRHSERIYVSSRYMWDSFVEEGVSEERLVLFPLIPHPRYAPGSAVRGSSTFDFVYVGSLTVAKGVPLLIDAFRRVARSDMRLTLVGGWATRAMRRFVQHACAEDPRITVSPGDPLQHLRGASVCVHPTYEDGFAYAPAEALACGLPVIVSEDTGMKELLDAGRTGHVFPTGDLSALAEALSAAYDGALFPRRCGRGDQASEIRPTSPRAI